MELIHHHKCERDIFKLGTTKQDNQFRLKT